MPAASEFIVEPLDPVKHRRETFDCGVKALSDFLRARARKEMEAGMSACFVLVPKAETERIAGFYTLSAATILRSELPEALVKKLPRYVEFPATLLGRLARSLDFKGQRIGDRLMVSALSRAVAGAQQVASWAVVADPKDENARRFYEAFGFKALTADRFFLPMKDAAVLLNAR
ncbi:MAG: GNAT family N-acetyltransferase [Opitutus sp.]|nr:GNAT family N-acetyltransferase [Opitutus sp.]